MTIKETERKESGSTFWIKGWHWLLLYLTVLLICTKLQWKCKLKWSHSKWNWSDAEGWVHFYQWAVHVCEEVNQVVWIYVGVKLHSTSRKILWQASHVWLWKKLTLGIWSLGQKVCALYFLRIFFSISICLFRVLIFCLSTSFSSWFTNKSILKIQGPIPSDFPAWMQLCPWDVCCILQ